MSRTKSLFQSFLLISLVFVFGACKEDPKTKIFVPRNFSEKFQTYQIEQAIKLFSEDRKNRYEFVMQRPTNPDLLIASGDALADELQKNKFDYYFAPYGSEASDLVATRLSEIAKKPDFLIGQISASKILNQKIEVLSTFPKSTDYFAGIPDLVKNHFAIKRVKIIRDQRITYFKKVPDVLRQKLQEVGIEDVEEIKFHGKKNIRSIWRRLQGVNNEDLIIFLTHHPSALKPPRRGSSVRQALKVFAYSPPSGKRTFEVLQQNSIRTQLFDSTDNPKACQFAKRFQKRFKQAPDFHAAHIYATLEIFEQKLAGKAQPYQTILGPIQLNKKGLSDYKPKYRYFDDNGEENREKIKREVKTCS